MAQRVFLEIYFANNLGSQNKYEEKVIHMTKLAVVHVIFSGKNRKNHSILVFILLFLYLLLIQCFCFGQAWGMWKFPSQGSNPSHSSENNESLISRPPGNSKTNLFFFNLAEYSWIIKYMLIYSTIKYYIVV